MSELNPPLNDEGMQVYCRWLHQALVRAREEHSIRSLRLVRAEVSFNWNSMGDVAVGRLLQALQRSELRVTSMSFVGNCLGPRGAAHVCDFIREVPFCIHEVNLSSNLLDDIPALDLLRLFAEHPRYPPKRSVAGKASDAVRLCLASNDIPQPARVLRRLEDHPGITVKLFGRQSAREWIVTKQGAPLLSLPNFDVQEDDASADAEYDRSISAYSRPPPGGHKEIWRPPPEPRTSLQAPKRQLASSARTRPELARPSPIPGVPEETPEPDASTPAKQKVKEESGQTERQEETPQKQPQRPPAMEQEDADDGLHLVDTTSKNASKTAGEESASSSPPLKPVRIMVPPKILQRPSPEAKSGETGARPDNT